MDLYIDPAYKAYYNNRLFDANDKVLNRDGTLLPFINLKSKLENEGITVQTFDLFNESSKPGIYWSFGVLNNIEKLSKDPRITLDAFFISEPPLVAPNLYKQLPLLTKYFKRVFVHNTTGDGYSLTGVDISKLRKQYWPQPYSDVLEKYWSATNRKNAILMINGQHRPRFGFGATELYSKRITAMIAISQHMEFDLFGRGWELLFNRNALWWSFIKNYSQIQKLYRGPVDSKFETMSKYDFALCFENLVMDGYITEKIFDCFYSGAIPIYWGPKNIQTLIPKDCYIQFNDFSSAKELVAYLLAMPLEKKLEFRTKARDFLLSQQGKRYTESLIIEFNKMEIPDVHNFEQKI